MKHINIEEKKYFKNILLVLGIITGFIFIVSFSTYYVSDAINKGLACGCVVPIPLMIILLSSLGVFVGSFTYYFISLRLIDKEKKICDDVLETLKFLENDERTIVKTLIENKEGIRQSDIEKKTSMNKVKVHRTLNKLISKGVVQKETNGKVNIISLSEKLKELF